MIVRMLPALPFALSVAFCGSEPAVLCHALEWKVSGSATLVSADAEPVCPSRTGVMFIRHP